MAETVYDFSARAIDGQDKSLSDYDGRVLLIVNTASKCGFTPQYQGLEALYRQFKDSGLTVLGFPCNQFADQEPGGEAEIAEFCQLNYGVSFPMFAKVDVNGPEAHPLFEFLKERAPGLLGSRRVKWNFTKFLVDRTGKPVARYAPQTKPEDLREDVAGLL